ncbi:MAG: hypothetical protein JW809_07245 [Pirellulales bacterium]|nr:hypothetical protein [Pirellulales bacterium]
MRRLTNVIYVQAKPSDPLERAERGIRDVLRRHPRGIAATHRSPSGGMRGRSLAQGRRETMPRQSVGAISGDRAIWVG